MEIDPVGVRVARANVSRNGVAHGVRVLRGTLPHPQVADGAYSVVVVNISARVITELAGALVNALADGGTLIASGVIEEHRPGVAEAPHGGGRPHREDGRGRRLGDDVWPRWARETVLRTSNFVERPEQFETILKVLSRAPKV